MSNQEKEKRLEIINEYIVSMRELIDFYINDRDTNSLNITEKIELNTLDCLLNKIEVQLYLLRSNPNVKS